MLPPNSSVRLRFEDLETDPLAEIERIYHLLGLELNDTYLERLEAYVASAANYRKNRFGELPDAERQKVDAAMGDYLVDWGYVVYPRRAAA